MELAAKVWQSVESWKLLARAEAVVVGCSGGPDSVALLLLLREISDRRQLDLKLHVAHLHHGIRGPEADADEQFVRQLALSLNLPFRAGRVDIPRLSLLQKRGLEEVARDERYAFLQQVALGVGARKVAVGHTADDQAETVLHRVLRGAGLQGLRAMTARRSLGHSGIELVRPLLNVGRHEILSYLESRQQGFRQDSTNRQTNLMRNRLRLELLPLLEERYNRNVRAALLRLSQVAAEAQDFLQIIAAEALARLLLCDSGRELALDARRLLELHPAVQREVVRLAVLRLKGNLRRLTRSHVESLMRMALDSASGRLVELPQGLTALKEQGQLKLRLSGPSTPRSWMSFALHVPGTTEMPDRGFQVRAETLAAAPELLPRFRSQKSCWEELMDLDVLRLPLHLRSWRAGDRMRPLGSRGTKKLQDLFTDRKVPRSDRAAVPVVTDRDDRPIWVVGLGIDEQVKVQEGTERILHLKVVPSECSSRGSDSHE